MKWHVIKWILIFLGMLVMTPLWFTLWEYLDGAMFRARKKAAERLLLREFWMDPEHFIRDRFRGKRR